MVEILLVGRLINVMEVDKKFIIDVIENIFEVSTDLFPSPKEKMLKGSFRKVENIFGERNQVPTMYTCFYISDIAPEIPYNYFALAKLEKEEYWIILRRATEENLMGLIGLDFSPESKLTFTPFPSFSAIREWLGRKGIVYTIEREPNGLYKLATIQPSEFSAEDIGLMGRRKRTEWEMEEVVIYEIFKKLYYSPK